ncbi:hypothetical protein ACR79N_15965 [Sphingobacterium siyangense]|uniref:hypothetical protein n=1 Tax=Sphingobacterium siyangense TaxID=459529 RepID=UPI003DA4503B
MKTIVTTILLFICIKSFSQGGFKINESNQVVWQKIYEDPLINFDDLVSTIKSNARCSDIDVYDDKITFIIQDVEPYTKGFSRMSTPFYILGKFKGFFTIDYKDHRYRITGNKLQVSIPLVNITSQLSTPKYEYTPYEEAVIKKGQFRKDFANKYYVLIENTLDREFKIIKSTDDNW